MELLSRTHPGFIAKLHGRDFVLQIATGEGVTRYFQVRHNRVSTSTKPHPSPELELRFVDNEVAFRLLTGGNANAFMAAMQAQEVQVIGDYSLLMWFMSIGQYMRPGARRESRPTASSAPSAG